VISGTIDMNGSFGFADDLNGGGGGSGGGILLIGNHIDISGAVLEANGGQGGSPTIAWAGGGGGAGGRIKVFYDSSISGSATMSISGGDGGVGTEGDSGLAGEEGTSTPSGLREPYPVKSTVESEVVL
jgi:hypothetical protein